MGFDIRENLHLSLYGVPGVAADGDRVGTVMKLMDRMWQDVKSRNLQNKGINVWVYEPGNAMFAGVELIAPPPGDSMLQPKEVFLAKYVYFKHIGPYEKIKDSCLRLTEEFKQAGIKTGLPYLEIYGHWAEDVSQLETELLWTLND